MTTTRVIRATEDNFDNSGLNDAALLLQQGELVAFPTETVYGLGANALDADAVAKIYRAKGRPSDNPLIVHVSSLDMLRPLLAPDAFPSPGSVAERLCRRFWPGPLTLLLRRSTEPLGAGQRLLPAQVTCGSPFVAVRMPSHPVALRLIERAALPVAAPSANVSGRPSPTTAAHVLEDFDGRIPCVIDGGPTSVGLESTVLDLNRDPPLVLRPGGVTLEQLRELLPTVELYDRAVHGTELERAPPTPGLKYRHYSPTARVVLFEQQQPQQESTAAAEDAAAAMQARVLQRLRRELDAPGVRRVGVVRTHPGPAYAVDGADVRVLAVSSEEAAGVDDDVGSSSSSSRPSSTSAAACVADTTSAAATAAPRPTATTAAAAATTDPTATTAGGRSSSAAGAVTAPEVLVYELGDASVPASVARGVFAALRRLDREGVSVILVEGTDERHEGLAVMNRLRKSASEIVGGVRTSFRE